MKRISILLLAATAFAVPACSTPAASSGGGDDDGNNNGSNGSDGSNGSNSSGNDWDSILANRVVDYNMALRNAALKLTGNLPTMTEVNQVASGADVTAQKAAYEALLADYMKRPTFATQMIAFWRDTFKMGTTSTTGVTAAMDGPAVFAAELAVTNQPYSLLLTRATGNCPTYDTAANKFTDTECANGGPKSGVLTNPSAMTQFVSNFAFRRVRWVNETFDCTRFPVEIAATGTDVGGSSLYTGTFPFDSIAGTASGSRVDFLDVSSAICANCHANLNHIAPLFAYYDATGQYKTTMSVPTPLTGAPPAVIGDYLPPGKQTFAWRFGKDVTDIPSLGAAMAADPAIAACAVDRIWNFALGKQDIVDQLVDVPPATIQTQLDAFNQNGGKLGDLIFAVFTSDAFVKF
jgi:hypothetical protein